MLKKSVTIHKKAQLKPQFQAEIEEKYGKLEEGFEEIIKNITNFTGILGKTEIFNDLSLNKQK